MALISQARITVFRSNETFSFHLKNNDFSNLKSTNKVKEWQKSDNNQTETIHSLYKFKNKFLKYN